MKNNNASYKNTALVSIIVPVFRVEKYVKRCIDSILNQTVKKLELILVDDNSDDNSGTICDLAAKSDNRIIVIHKNEQEGVAKARESGVMRASAPYICFVDSDDWIEPNYCEILIKTLEQNDADLVCCSYFYDFEKNNKVHKRIPRKVGILKPNDAIDELHLGKSIWACVWNKIYKRDLLRFPKLDKKVTIGEDYSLIIDYLLNCNKIVQIKIALYHYFQRSESVSYSGYTFNYYEILKNYSYYCKKLSKFYPEIKYNSRLFCCVQQMGAITAMTRNNHYDFKLIKNIQHNIRKYWGICCFLSKGNIIEKTAIFLLVLNKFLFIFVAKIFMAKPRN